MSVALLDDVEFLMRRHEFIYFLLDRYKAPSEVAVEPSKSPQIRHNLREMTYAYT
jgi:hypothetical protein